MDNLYLVHRGTQYVLTAIVNGTAYTLAVIKEGEKIGMQLPVGLPPELFITNEHGQLKVEDPD